MLKLKISNHFKRDIKLAEKRRYDFSLLKGVVESLLHEEILPEANRDHPLMGKYIGCRECHIAPDWLLVYKIQKDVLTLSLLRTGTHSDLF